MKITIVYDNETVQPDLESDWGFACLVESDGKCLLFDTGGRSALLLRNLAKLHLKPQNIPEVFISHDHWDHLGGLEEFLRFNPYAVVYLPGSCARIAQARQVIRIQGPCALTPNRFSTGPLGGVEQSLVIKAAGGLIIICGCAHPGVETIIDTASQFGPVSALVGGLHGCKNFHRLGGLKLICPCHCTKYKSEILRLFPDIAVPGGAGRVLEFA